ncbi:MAG: hypothetical protein ACRDHZ_07650 [Ktedonobacteraceae bacterium]
MMKPRTISIGEGTMLVNSEDFLNGYQAGYLAFLLDTRLFQMTNEHVTAVMMEKLEDIDSSEQYSVGYCIGWIATLATKGNNVSVHKQQPEGGLAE